MFEPAVAFEADGPVLEGHRTLRRHLRSGVIVGQAEHGFGILSILRIDPDAFQPPIGHRHHSPVACSVCGQVQAEGLIPFVVLRVVARHRPGFGGRAGNLW